MASQIMFTAALTHMLEVNVYMHNESPQLWESS